MPENLQLDAFLAGKPAPDAPPAEPPVAAKPAVADTPPDPPEAPQAAPEGPDEPSTAEPEKEPREPQHFRELRSSVEAAKREREDWKARAIRAETEHAELRKQWEAAQRAPAAQAAPPPPQMDIREAMAADPLIKAAVLTRLDTSEMILRREIGDEAVNALQADFTAAMGRDPTLQARVLTQRDPYRGRTSTWRRCGCSRTSATIRPVTRRGCASGSRPRSWRAATGRRAMELRAFRLRLAWRRHWRRPGVPRPARPPAGPGRRASTRSWPSGNSYTIEPIPPPGITGRRLPAAEGNRAPAAAEPYRALTRHPPIHPGRCRPALARVQVKAQ